MQNLTHTKEITEGKAMEAIFNACRANPGRKNNDKVTFIQYAEGSPVAHATLRNEQGFVIASAMVDQYDI
jgi:hypothetical protein